MGQSVLCSCGRRNDLDSYGYGEPRICVACGGPLPQVPVTLGAYQKDGFAPVVTGLDSQDDAGGPSVLTGFESPTPEEPATDPVSGTRAWHDRVPEPTTSGDTDGARCARCQKAFRGAWDRHERPEGAICHICSTRADTAHTPPTAEQRRELLRPDPPKKTVPAPQSDSVEPSTKRREMLVLGAIAIIVLVFINVFPVEEWAALLFAADLSKAEGLPVLWHWVARVGNFVISVLVHSATLYVALAWTGLLFEGGLRSNAWSLLQLGVCFALLNMGVDFIHTYFGVFGTAAGILAGLALIVSLVIKLLMIAARFPLRLEGGVAFFLAWALAGLVMKPCMVALHQLVQGVVAAVAL